MKFFISFFLFISCNVMKIITNGETDVDNDFYQRSCQSNDCSSSDENTSTEDQDDDVTSRNDVISFWRLNETGLTENRVDSFGGNDIIHQVGSLVSNVGFKDGETGIDCGAMSGSDYMQITSANLNLNFGFNTDFTISFWARMDTSEGSSNSLFELRESGDTLHISTPASSGNLFFDVGAQGVTGVNAFENTFEWYHFIFWADRDSELRIYRNGELLDSNSISTTSENIGASLRQLTICGRDSAGLVDRFNGLMDSVGIWNRLLSEDEIDALYNGNNQLD